MLIKDLFSVVLIPERCGCGTLMYRIFIMKTSYLISSGIDTDLTSTKKYITVQPSPTPPSFLSLLLFNVTSPAFIGREGSFDFPIYTASRRGFLSSYCIFPRAHNLNTPFSAAATLTRQQLLVLSDKNQQAWSSMLWSSNTPNLFL